MLINLLHKKWRIVVRSDKVHNEKFPDTHAVAVLDDRKIYIRKSSVTLETVAHELVHALTYELSFTELQLDDDQIEEFFCEMFAKYGRSLLQIADSVVKHYKK